MADIIEWLICWSKGCYQPALWYMNPNWGVSPHPLDVFVCTVHLSGALLGCMELQLRRGDPIVSVLVEPSSRAPISRPTRIRRTDSEL